MTSWLDCIDDVRALTAVYGERVPEPTGVRISEVAIDLDRHCVRVGFDLPEFPAEPPAKWRNFNTVHVAMLLSDLIDVRMDGLPVRDVADLELARRGSGITLSLTGSGLNVAVRCGFVFLQKVSAYQQGSTGSQDSL